MKSLFNFLTRQASLWAVLAAAGLILSGSAAYADEPAPTGKAADGYIFTLNNKSAETLYNMKEKRLKAIEASQAAQEEKACKAEKKAKCERLQGKTGRSATSWQVLNR